MNGNNIFVKSERPESLASQQTPPSGKRRRTRISFPPPETFFQPKTPRLDQDQEVQPIIQAHFPPSQQSQQQNTEMDNELDRLRTENKKNDEHLSMYAKLINELEVKCAEMDNKLKEQADTIKKLQEQNKALEQRNINLMANENSADEESQEEIAEEMEDQLTSTSDDQQRTEKTPEETIKSVKQLEDHAMKTQTSGKYYTAVNCWKEAIEEEEKGQNRPSKLAAFFANKSECHSKLKQHQEQFDNANSALRYDSNSAIALKNRAWGNYALKKYLDAQSDFQKLLKLKPGNVNALGGLHKVQKKTNEELDE